MSNEEESLDNLDMDAFLISVESKLRGPFSSLDLGRAIASAHSPREYLQNISMVLPRMDKVVQLRVLVGLLGVDPSEDTDDVIFKILTEAQEAPLHEEWVRVAAGLVQGILFYRHSGERDMGDEVQKLLEKTCKDILSREPLATDADPLFAPYYYSLLNPDTLHRILPECMSNPHFSANENAEIIRQDDTLEQDEQPVSASRLVEEAPAVALPPVIMPGRGTTNTFASKLKQPASKSSMFLPSKKPASATGGRLGRQLAVRTTHCLCTSLQCGLLILPRLVILLLDHEKLGIAHSKAWGCTNTVGKESSAGTDGNRSSGEQWSQCYWLSWSAWWHSNHEVWQQSLQNEND